MSTENRMSQSARNESHAQASSPDRTTPVLCALRL